MILIIFFQTNLTNILTKLDFLQKKKEEEEK